MTNLRERTGRYDGRDMAVVFELYRWVLSATPGQVCQFAFPGRIVTITVANDALHGGSDIEEVWMEEGA